jgi:hypothetical protein
MLNLVGSFLTGFTATQALLCIHMGVRHSLVILFLGSCIAAAGCQSSSDEPTPSAAGSPAAGGPTSSKAGATSSGSAAVGDIQGSIVLSLVAPSDENEGYSAVLGRFFDGPTPSPIPLELDTEQGNCQLLVPSHPFCSTPCTPDACTADDVCTKYPTPIDVGPIAISGLGAPLNVQPSTSMFIYQPPSLPYPPCAEGDAVRASASGFSLQAACIAPLEVTSAEPIPVKKGAPVHLAWTPAAGSARIRIGLDLAHHGGKKGEIDCNVPDTGEFDIPEPLVTKLIGLGLAGFPTISVSRVSLGSDAAKPEVALVISQSVLRAIDSGVTSCQEDPQCTAPQTCRDDKTCG